MNLDPFPRPFSCNEKASIKYPCSWLYKVIGHNEDALRKAIKTVLSKDNLIITKSNTSSGGKYCSLNVDVVVENEKSRLENYNNLKNHAAVKVVL